MFCLSRYGPDALGKGKICPRDGKPDCSLVDALRKDLSDRIKTNHEKAPMFLCGCGIMEDGQSNGTLWKLS